MARKRSIGTGRIIGRLKMLVKASELLNSSLDLDTILDVLLRYTVKSLNATGGTIYLFDRPTGVLSARRMVGGKPVEIRLGPGEGIAGFVAKTGKTVRIADAYKDKRFFRGIDRRSGFKTRSMLCAPMKNKAGKLVGVFQILNKRKGKFTPEDARFLSSISIPATIAIENARLHQAEMEGERMRRDLELAAALQRQILPTTLPQGASYELEAMTSPCRTVGGDFYDAIEDGKGNIVLVVADASGKGIGAALLVSTFQAALHTYVEFGLSLPEIAFKLNRILYEDSTVSSFVTCILASFDEKTSSLRYVNAGHNNPILRTADGKETELITGGVPLGMVGNAGYDEGEVLLRPGDLLLVYTDGLTEAMDNSGILYGEDRLRKILQQAADLPLHETGKLLFDDVRAHLGSDQQNDDLTLLLLRIPRRKS
jgi:sigma-B regulation protein RsbU (phosphoserine phosphatase)